MIVNHHLFFADLGIKQQARTAPDAGILPEAAVVIFDEAHELEDVASNYFGVSLSNMRFEELVRDLETMLRTKITIATSVLSAGQTVRERARMFFGALPQDFEGRAVFSQREEFLENFGDHLPGADECAAPAGGRAGAGARTWTRRPDCGSGWRTSASI